MGESQGFSRLRAGLLRAGNFLKWLGVALGGLVVTLLLVHICLLYHPHTPLRDSYVVNMIEPSFTRALVHAFMSDARIEGIKERNRFVPPEEKTDISKVVPMFVRTPTAALTPSPTPLPTPTQDPGQPLPTPDTALTPEPLPTPTRVPTPIPTPTPPPRPSGTAGPAAPAASGNRVYDRDVRSDGVEGVSLYRVAGDGYVGHMVVIDDPSRVSLALAPYLGSVGSTVPEIGRRSGAIVAINGGEFEDPEGRGNGGQPKGCLVAGGEPIHLGPEGRWNIIGMNSDHILVLGNYSWEEMQRDSIVDAVTFGPYLIVNGTLGTAAGIGGGQHPRSAIGQRSDGAILMLIIDGRQPGHSLGCSCLELMYIMNDFGAVNAANLDGGSSSVLYFFGEVLNKPSNLSDSGRRVPNGFVVAP